MCVCVCCACTHTHTQCRTCAPPGITTASRFASAAPDRTSAPAKTALPSWPMVAVAAVSVCEPLCVRACACQSYSPTCSKTCSTAACSNTATDVVFLIDGSKSVRPENFELVKKWINQIIDKLDVADSKAHVGLVQYSSGVREVRPVVNLGALFLSVTAQVNSKLLRLWP